MMARGRASGGHPRRAGHRAASASASAGCEAGGAHAAGAHAAPQAPPAHWAATSLMSRLRQRPTRSPCRCPSARGIWPIRWPRPQPVCRPWPRAGSSLPPRALRHENSPADNGPPNRPRPAAACQVIERVYAAPCGAAPGCRCSTGIAGAAGAPASVQRRDCRPGRRQWQVMLQSTPNHTMCFQLDVSPDARTYNDLESNCAPMQRRALLRPPARTYSDFDERLFSDVTPSHAATLRVSRGSTAISTRNCAPMQRRLLLRQRPAEVAQRLPVPILVAHVVAESPLLLKRGC